MAYYVSPQRRFLDEVAAALSAHFGGKALVSREPTARHSQAVTVTVKEGFPREEKRLTPAQVEEGVIGGGTVAGMDGLAFSVAVVAVHTVSYDDSTPIPG